MAQKKPPWYFLLLLILVGESVFIIPFVLARIAAWYYFQLYKKVK